jgi:hypothetical protein
MVRADIPVSGRRIVAVGVALQIPDHRRSDAHEVGDLLAGQPVRRRRVHSSGGGGEVCLQGAGALGEQHPYTAPVGTVKGAP